MGFSSWNCLGCGKPVMNPYNLPGTRLWENDVIALAFDGTRHEGSYNGYGGVGCDTDAGRFPIDWEANQAAEDAWVEGDEEPLVGLPGLWHRLCFEKAEKEDQRYRPSSWARNQGYVKEL